LSWKQHTLATLLLAPAFQTSVMTLATLFGHLQLKNGVFMKKARSFEDWRRKERKNGGRVQRELAGVFCCCFLGLSGYLHMF